MSPKKLNSQYLLYLSKYPLLTKSVTAGALAGLNEIIASCLTKDFKKLSIGKVNINHVLTPKLMTMIIYGSLIITPISHSLYGILNRVFKGPNLTKSLKVLQILTSLSTITPTLAAVFTGWISIVNGYTLSKSLNTFDLRKEIVKLISIIRIGLKKNYFSILKTSVLTSLVSLVIAQNFIKPELWVVFFNLVYFVLGTIQNIKLKKSQKKNKIEANDDNEKEN